jgi:hypothetical protein
VGLPSASTLPDPNEIIGPPPPLLLAIAHALPSQCMIIGP